jgi:hypothetical protein
MTKRLPALALAASLVIGVAASIASSGPSAAKAKFPTPAQTTHCAKAAKGHNKLTKSQVFDCTGLPLIKQSCPTGPGAIVVKFGKTNFALRQGRKPLRLGKSYTVTQLAAVCGKPHSTSTSLPAVAIAPTTTTTTTTTTRPAPVVTTTTRAPIPVTTTTAAPPPTTAAPAACHPTSAAGNCYQAGEYCSDADHGLTGVAGNGATITCEDNNGWRWVAT